MCWLLNLTFYTPLDFQGIDDLARFNRAWLYEDLQTVRQTSDVRWVQQAKHWTHKLGIIRSNTTEGKFLLLEESCDANIDHIVDFVNFEKLERPNIGSCDWT